MGACSQHTNQESTLGPKRLVLWDIDHTLIETRGVGAEVFAAAFEAATGKRLEAMPDPTGLTEAEIFRRAADAQGIDADATFDHFAQLQAAEYRARSGELRTRGRVLPGVHAALRTIANAPDLLQTVLSGNTRAGSAAKLTAFRLDTFLDLTVSAGGDDDPVRANLVPIVWDRVAKTHGISFSPHDTVLLGDTPADIETGHAHGCRVIAVATGRADIKQLRTAGADQTFADLTDTTAVLRAISMNHRDIDPHP
jgi:phosphoglycolate phosphatase-like HAD superfamily hydrolase